MTCRCGSTSGEKNCTCPAIIANLEKEIGVLTRQKNQIIRRIEVLEEHVFFQTTINKEVKYP